LDAAATTLDAAAATFETSLEAAAATLEASLEAAAASSEESFARERGTGEDSFALRFSRRWIGRVYLHVEYHRGWTWERCTTVYTIRWRLFFARGRLYLVCTSVSTSH
jgi:hypothetical protein